MTPAGLICHLYKRRLKRSVHTVIIASSCTKRRRHRIKIRTSILAFSVGYWESLYTLSLLAHWFSNKNGLMQEQVCYFRLLLLSHRLLGYIYSSQKRGNQSPRRRTPPVRCTRRPKFTLQRLPGPVAMHQDFLRQSSLDISPFVFISPYCSLG
jgi:hypothetical protein